MRLDCRGLEVSCEGEADLAATEDFSRRLLRLATGTDAVLAAADRFPETPLLQLQAAAAHLFGQTAADDARAGEYLARAAALEARANPREECLRRALVEWHCHEFTAAVGCLEELTAQWPADLLAAKLAEFLYYVIGQEHEARRFRRHMERLAPHHAADPDFLAMQGFARELSGAVELARATAERALEIEPQNPWADHALSHVWIRSGEVERAIERMSAALPVARANSRAIHSHNAWHLAVHHLERLDAAAALAVFDREIWPRSDALAGVQLDATALLWRTAMAGGDVGRREAGIADRVEERLTTCFMPFLSAHDAYVLARAGRHEALALLLARVAERAAQPGAEAQRSWAGAGRALVEAAAAFGAGDAARCAEMLDPVIAQVTVGGGSDAQCDLFRQTYVLALAGSGRAREARAALERLFPAPPTPLRDSLRARLV
jgi:tetratricopeptide repeat protein